MPLLASENLVRRGLPIWYAFLAFVALVEVGIAGYLTGKGDNGGTYDMSLRNRVRFALFAALWTLVFNFVIAFGTWKTIRVINTGAVHFAYLIITLIFWIAVGASLETAISGSVYPHRTTLRACEWFGWISAILIFFISIPWTLLGVSHAKEGIRGSVATA